VCDFGGRLHRVLPPHAVGWRCGGGARGGGRDRRRHRRHRRRRRRWRRRRWWRRSHADATLLLSVVLCLPHAIHLFPAMPPFRTTYRFPVTVILVHKIYYYYCYFLPTCVLFQ